MNVAQRGRNPAAVVAAHPASAETMARVGELLRRCVWPWWMCANAACSPRARVRGSSDALQSIDVGHVGMPCLGRRKKLEVWRVPRVAALASACDVDSRLTRSREWTVSTGDGGARVWPAPAARRLRCGSLNATERLPGVQCDRETYLWHPACSCRTLTHVHARATARTPPRADFASQLVALTPSYAHPAVRRHSRFLPRLMCSSMTSGPA